MRSSNFLAFVLGFCFLFPPRNAALADTVFLLNGDRISGDIEQMQSRRLSIDTEYAGVIEIEWRKVGKLQAARPFTVWLEGGVRATGTLAPTEDGFKVVGDNADVGAAPVQVVRMYPLANPVEDNFWERWEGDIDVGFSLTGGNAGLSQSYVGIDTKYRTERYELQWDASSLQSGQSDAGSVSRQTFSLQLDRTLGRRAYAFGLAKLERDINQRLALRSNLGGGYGWHLVQRARTQFAVLGGATFTNEQFRDIGGGGLERAASSAEGLAGFEFETDRFFGIEVTSKLQMLPALTGERRLRISFDNNIRVPLTRRFTWGLLVYDRYDSVPQPGVKRNDVGVAGTFGFGF